MVPRKQLDYIPIVGCLSSIHCQGSIYPFLSGIPDTGGRTRSTITIHSPVVELDHAMWGGPGAIQRQALLLFEEMECCHIQPETRVEGKPQYVGGSINGIPPTKGGLMGLMMVKDG